jgi:hypothetical protein
MNREHTIPRWAGIVLDSYVWTSTPDLFGSSSSLLGASNDGDDTLIDADKVGRLLINGSGVKILIKQTATTWTSPDNKVTLTQGQDTAISWKLSIDGGGSIDLGGSFNDGDYGITRLELPTAIAAAIVGDLKPVASPTGTDPVTGQAMYENSAYDSNGNLYVATTAEANRADNLNGTSAAEPIRGLGGSDILLGRGGNDLIEGGAGSGDDLLLGDLTFTGSIDRTWAVRRIVGSTADGGTLYTYKIDNATTDNPMDTGGMDALYGGSGKDWALGGAGDDLVDGGSNDDVLFGDAGNDIVLGGTGDDVINGDNASLPNSLQGDDWLDGGDGNDAIYGMAGMRATHPWLKHMAKLGVLLMMGASMSAKAGLFGIGGDRWKEEALQPDGSKVVVERSVSRKGRHEIGQRPAIGNQSLTFAMPGTGQQVKWEDLYSEDVGGGNFSPMLLGVLQGKAYVLASPTGCLSYNKWGRPNPPYVIFRYEGKEWKRIALADLPAEFKLPNLIISSPDDEVEKSGTRFITAEMVGRMNQGFGQAEYKSILREAIPSGGQASCPELVFYKGAWVGPGDSIGKRMMDSKTK